MKVDLKKAFLAILFVCSSVHLIAQKLSYKVYAVRFAQSGYPFFEGDWAAGGSKTKHVDINFSVWLIKASNGRNILVDAGFEKDIEDAREFKLSTYIRPDSALLRLGIKAGDITDVIISHPHWDHIEGVNLFPKAHFWIQKDDYNYFVGQAWQKPVDAGGFAKRDVRKLVDLNMAGRVTLINGDGRQILPGITVFTGSKHTYQSQYALVNTGKTKIIIASDNVWVYANLQQLLPAAPGGTMDPKAYVNAMKRMKTIVTNPKLIIPGHDGDVYKRFPEISKGIVEIK